MEEKRSKEKIVTLEIYTDGSCKSMARTTFGGWAFVVIQDSKEVYCATGSEVNTTNQRMELEAIKSALDYIKTVRRANERVVVYSDSAYAINCYNKGWYQNWIANGWRNASKQPVANQDLWEEIIPYFDNFWYSFHKVEGHAGDYWNEVCDERAQAEAKKLKDNWRG